MRDYQEELERKVADLQEMAVKARSLGLDPELGPEIHEAKELAGRVETLVGPPGVAEYIKRLQPQVSREKLALDTALAVVKGEFGQMEPQQGAEQAVRTALAVLTEGIVVAPLEGITQVKIKQNFDGTSYLAIYFASPIRAAGGTAAALAVLVGDSVRQAMHIGAYKPTTGEVERFVEEVELYKLLAREQYTPPPHETRFAVQHIPVEITGEPTGDTQVSTFRNLERIEHNFIRGGAVLVLTEGIMQKAPKILKHVKNLGIDGWDWLAELTAKSPDQEVKIPREDRYLDEVIAGRPVFSHPGGEGHRGHDGGFRLRYGRARNTGIAAVGVHPATMVICDDFIAVGTQLKTERPGKAGAAVPVDSIEGPVVKLKDGSVVQVKTEEEALELKGKIDEILFLGDILIGFGEFLENNHPLMPAGYCQEWWSQEVKRALAGRKFEPDLSQYLSPPYPAPVPSLAVRISEELGVPLHPAYTYPFHDLKTDELVGLGSWLSFHSQPKFEGRELKSLRLPLIQGQKRILERLGVPHKVEDKEVVIEGHALPLCKCLGLLEGQRFRSGHDFPSLFLRTKRKLEETCSDPTVTDVIQALAGFPVRKKAPTRIGARMGRPEKAAARMMQPPVHVLFPVGLAGGSTRSLDKAAASGKEIHVEIANLKCGKCGYVGFTRRCQNCGSIAELVKACPQCGHQAMPKNIKPNKQDGTEELIRIVKKLEGEWGGAAPLEKVYEEASRCGSPQKDTKGRIEDFKKKGFAYSPTPETVAMAHEPPELPKEKPISSQVSFETNDRCPKCNTLMAYFSKRALDLKSLFEAALEYLCEKSPGLVKGVQGMTSAYKIPEPIQKGVLRAKHGVYVFKDGTIRFDMTNVPLTHFRPKEIGTPVERLQELGYTKDIDGHPLENDDQLLELGVQDVVVSREGLEYLFKASGFVDELLQKLYGLPPYYNAVRPSDLIGHIIIALAPHTSAGVVGRVIGSVEAEVCYAHPFFHAARRRDCDGDQDCMMLLLDALLNFSKRFLPSSRGGTMDAPLILNVQIDPKEIDKQAHNMDVMTQYPIEFYEATQRYASPVEIAKLMKTATQRLGTATPCEGLKFSFDTSDIAAGPKSSKYKTLTTMEEKVNAQLRLAEKIRAVDERDVAGLVIRHHFIPDLKGNIRTFAGQSLRCTHCNATFRRPPLRSVCSRCGGKLVLTVTQGGIEKYLQIALRVAKEYHTSEYIQQRLLLIQREIESTFKSGAAKQVSLADFL